MWSGQDTCERGHRHRPPPGDSSPASLLQAPGSLEKLSGTVGHSDGRSGHFVQIPKIMCSHETVMRDENGIPVS